MKFLLSGIALIPFLILFGHSVAEEPMAPAKLVPETRTLDFGEVWGQSNFHWQVKVRNPSPRSIQVKELSTACSCVEANPKSFVVPPGGTKNIDVVLDLRDNGVRLSADEATGPYSSFSAAIKPIYSDIETTPADIWYVTGNLRHPFDNVPRVWDIGSVTCDSSEQPTAILPVACASGVSLTGIHFDQEWGHATVAKSPSNKTSLLFYLRNRSPGPFEFPLQLRAETRDGVELPPVSVQVTGRVVGDVEVYPSEVALGLLRPGQNSENTVFIRSRSGQALYVDQVVCSDDHIEIAPPQDSENENVGELAYKVKSTSGKQPGNYSTIVHFEVHTEDQAPVTVSYRLTYTVCEISL
ncbi:DUF1573 domain-containing protein [Symmachiella dynata]|uniref:DUF1573 domain-containing protein n=1 Tax=Symmachiella dynata TaxID=2527995 RepID=UPI0030EEB864